MRPTSDAPKTRATPGAVRTLRSIAGTVAVAVTLANRFGGARIVRQTVEAMIRYRFGQDDLLRTRFAVSPLFEVVWSAHILRRPEQAPLHGPWVADARECLAGLDWSMLDWLAHGYGQF